MPRPTPAARRRAARPVTARVARLDSSMLAPMGLAAVATFVVAWLFGA